MYKPPHLMQTAYDYFQLTILSCVHAKTVQYILYTLSLLQYVIVIITHSTTGPVYVNCSCFLHTAPHEACAYCIRFITFSVTILRMIYI